MAMERNRRGFQMQEPPHLQVTQLSTVHFDPFREKNKKMTPCENNIVWIPLVSASFMGTEYEHVDAKVTIYTPMDPIP